MTRQAVLPKAFAQARHASGKSQRQVAEEAGVSAGYVAMIELGQRCPLPETAARLAKVLGVEVEALLRRNP